MPTSSRILYLGNPSYGNLEWSLSRAFERIGCVVDVLDITGERWLAPLGAGSLPFRIGMRLARPVLPALLDRALARQSGRYDLVFVHKNLSLHAHALRRYSDRVGARLFCFYPDDPFDPLPVRANANTRALIPLVDHYFTFGRFIEGPLRDAGARAVTVLPFAHDPELHAPPSLDEATRARLHCQLAFVGNYSAERAMKLRPLLEHDLGLWGHHWERAIALDARFARALRGTAQVGRAFAEIYAAADIGLNLIQAYPDGHNMRSFEAPACGGMVMSNRTRELSELFREDEELVCFGDEAELREKVAHYLAHPAERGRIARAGRARVEHETYDRRAAQIVALSADDAR